MRQKGQILQEIAEELKKEGFQTSRRDPFFAWVHGIPVDQGAREGGMGDTLYILEPPVPKIAPFDFAAVSLRIDRDHLFFQLSLYYTIESVVDAETINELYDLHATRWAPALHTFFNDIANEFSLTWDTEYDEYIEDSLCGMFLIDSSHRIVEIMSAIKRQSAKWKQEGN